MIVTEDKYGLVGHPLGHSLSPWIHQKLMSHAGLEATYELLDINPQDFLQDMPKLLSHYRGLNVTIPYKERIISLLDSLDNQASSLRSVNTVLNGRGYNTDREGFLSDGPVLYDRSIMILGAGGVSRMLAFAAAGERASRIVIWARRTEQAKSLADDVLQVWPDRRVEYIADPDELPGRNWVVLHGTPAGMWPNTGTLPLPEKSIHLLLTKAAELYDTVYNPVATRLVLLARSAGVPAQGGLGMLFGQAVAAQRLWNPQAEFEDEFLIQVRDSLAAAVYTQFPLSIVLTGFMGSGKSTVGALLSEYTGLPLVDLDSEIEKTAGKSISDVFAQDGEAAFRDLEHDMLAACLGQGNSQILATGGGALTAERNIDLVRSSPALTIYLNATLPEIRRRIGRGQSRPLWRDDQSEELQKLYDRRQGIYSSVADRSISADQDPEQLAAALAADLGFGGKKK